MSLLPSATFANPSTPFYAANGGGGGGSSLTSPATITPDATGNVSLALNAITTPGSTPTSGATVSVVNNVTGGGGAAVIVSDTTGNDAALQLLNTAGGNSLILMGTAAAPVGIIAPSLTAAGQIQMGVVNVPAGSIPTPVVKIDAANNIVDIANPLAAASVFLNGQTFVTSSASRPPTNALVLSNSSPTASAITQQVASGGTLQLGSSVAQPTTVQLQEATGGGGYGYVTIGGQSGGTGDRLKMYGGGAACSITTDDPATGGVLNIGADDTGPTFQSLAFTHNAVAVNVPMTYSATSGPPLAAFSPTILRNGITPIGTTAIGTAGLAAGVYLCYGRAVASTDAGDLAARFSSVIQVGVGGSCVGGGQVTGQTNTYILAPNGTTGLNLTLVAATTAAYQVIAFPMFLI